MRLVFHLIICLGFLSGLLIPAYPQAPSDTVKPSPSAWHKVAGAVREIDFLEGVADFVLEADGEMLSTAVSQLDSLSPERKWTAQSILVKAFQEADEKKYNGYFTQNWDSLDDELKFSWLSNRFQKDAEQTISLVFENSLYQSYQGTVIEWLAWKQPKEAAGYLDRIVDESSRQQVSQQIAYALLKDDAEAGFKWAVKHLPAEALQDVLSHLFYQEDPELKQMALDELEKLPDSESKRQLELTLAHHLSYSDPEIAIQWLDRFEGEERKQFASNLLNQLAWKKSPQAAELLQTLTSDQLPQVYVIKNILTEWTLREPDKARVWAEALPDGKTRDGSLLRINTMLGQIDPQLAIDQTMNTPPGLLRKEMIRNTGLLLCKKDLKEGLAWVDALPESPDKQHALHSIAYLMDRRDPVEFAAIAMDMTPGPAKDKMFNSMFDRWANRDAVAAFRWATSLMESDAGINLKNHITYQLAYQAPAEAVKMLQEPGISPKVKDGLFGQLLSNYGSSNPELIKTAVDSFLDGSAGLELNRSNLKALANLAPEEAIRLSVESSDPKNPSDFSQLFQDWALRDPQPAAAYAIEIGRLNEGLNIPYDDIAGAWATMDIEAARSWVSLLPAGKEKEVAGYRLESYAAYLHPEKSFLNLTSIEKPADSRARLSGLRKVVEEWAYHDPAKAKASIESATISNSDKKTLLKTIEYVKNQK